MASNTSMELGKLIYGEEEDMKLGIGSLGWNSISSPLRIGECLLFAVFVLYDCVLRVHFSIVLCCFGCQKLSFLMLSALPKWQAK